MQSCSLPIAPPHMPAPAALVRWCAFLLALLFVPVITQAQCVGTWSPLGSGATQPVYAVAVLPNGDVIVGGEFLMAGGAQMNGIARYSPSTGTWSPLGNVLAGSVRALAVLPDGDVLAVGGLSLSTNEGVLNIGVGRYRPSTDTWSAPQSGIDVFGASTLAVLPGGDVVVGGGTFMTSGGAVVAEGVARYSPSTGLWSPLGSGVQGTIYALAALPGDEIVVGGGLITGVEDADGLLRYSPSTGVWSAFGSGTVDTYGVGPGIVFGLVTLPGGNLLASGTFSAIDGVAANGMAMFNPTSGAWSALGSGFPPGQAALTFAALPDGDVVAGGAFESIGGVPAFNIARLNPATGQCSSLGEGAWGMVFALAVFPGGDVIAGGDFTEVGPGSAPTTVNYIARYNFGAAANILSHPAPDAACAGGIATFSVTAAGTGPFTYQWFRAPATIVPGETISVLTITNASAADAGAYYCVVSNACGSATSDPATLSICFADLNCDDGVDITDLLFFLSAFEAGSFDVDLDNGTGAGTPDGAVDVNDLLFFLARFEVGC